MQKQAVKPHGSFIMRFPNALQTYSWFVAVFPHGRCVRTLRVTARRVIPERLAHSWRRLEARHCPRHIRLML